GFTERQRGVARRPQGGQRHRHGRRERLDGQLLLQEPVRGGRGHQPRGAARGGPRGLLHDGPQRHPRPGRPHARGPQDDREGPAALRRRQADDHQGRPRDRGHGPGHRPGAVRRLRHEGQGGLRRLARPGGRRRDDGDGAARV
ncbi:MAG: Peroxiredoxin OsmC, partial [uncultured Solirubrobacterales bacterium]